MPSPSSATTSCYTSCSQSTACDEEATTTTSSTTLSCEAMAEYTPWYTDADSELTPTLGIGGYGGQVIITGGTSISRAPTSGPDSPSGADEYVVIAFSTSTDIWYWIDQTGNGWTGSFLVGRSFAGPEVTDVNNLPFPDVTVEANESLGSTVNGCSYTGTSEWPGVMTRPDETIQCVTGALDPADGIYPIVEW